MVHNVSSHTPHNDHYVLLAHYSCSMTQGGRGADLIQSAALTSKVRGVKAADNNSERAHIVRGGLLKSWLSIQVEKVSILCGVITKYGLFQTVLSDRT